jgi:glycosidase
MSWLKDAVLYHIFIDRFNGNLKGDPSKSEFVGGNLRGIIKKLDYIKKLKINTLWISPFYETSAYHGYHITDYYKVDKHFGNLNDLKELINKVHTQNMKLVVDFVPNHCSDKHPFFQSAQKNKKSKYRKWFYFDSNNDYLCFMDVKELPKFNLDNQETRKYILDVAKYWLSLGIDGFRIDHAIGPSHNFWKYFSTSIKKEYPNSVLFGEIWWENMPFKYFKTIKTKNKYMKWFLKSGNDFYLKEYLNEFDGAIDFEFNKLIKQYVHEEIDIKQLKHKLKKHYSRFPKSFNLISFLGNHDMNRFMFECKNDESKFENSIKIQFSQQQPKIIYYGDEIGMTQKRDISSLKVHGDLLARKIINFNNAVKFYKKVDPPGFEPGTSAV